MELPKDIPIEHIRILNTSSTKVSEEKDTLDQQVLDQIECVLLKKVEEGKLKAYFQLGQLYFEEEKYEKALELFTYVQDYDYQALFQLAVMYYDGLGCKPNASLGVYYLKSISMCNLKQVKHLRHPAQYNIGRAYFQGFGVPQQSDEEAEKWWLLAADDGSPEGSVIAQSTLGMFYSRKETYDLKKAFFWHSEACGNGNLESQGVLGIMYMHGFGVPKDLDSAYVCLKEAASRGNVYAMGKLTQYYYQRKFYNKASNLGERVAALNDVSQIAINTKCLKNFIVKGIAIGCFYYATCLKRRNLKEAAEKFYSKSFEFDADMCAQLQNLETQGIL